MRDAGFESKDEVRGRGAVHAFQLAPDVSPGVTCRVRVKTGLVHDPLGFRRSRRESGFEHEYER